MAPPERPGPAPRDAGQQDALQRQAAQSLRDQVALETSDKLSFDDYLAHYLSPQRLVLQSEWA